MDPASSSSLKRTAGEAFLWVDELEPPPKKARVDLKFDVMHPKHPQKSEPEFKVPLSPHRVKKRKSDEDDILSAFDLLKSSQPLEVKTKSFCVNFPDFPRRSTDPYLTMPCNAVCKKLPQFDSFIIEHIDDTGKSRYLKYVGEIKDSKPHGRGILHYENGKGWYEGKFQNGTPHGNGKIYYPSGKLWYEGELQNGLKTGKGKSYYIDGNIAFEGEFVSQIPHGTGTLYYRNGIKWYMGEFRNGLFHGLGTLYFDGKIVWYTGSFCNGLKDGSGQIFDITGKLMYAGLFVNDRPFQYVSIPDV